MVAVPETDSSDAVNLDYLLITLDPDEDNPISQTIRDVLAAAPADTEMPIVIREWSSGSEYEVGQLSRSNSNKVFICISPIAEGSAASQIPPEESGNWQLIT